MHPSQQPVNTPAPARVLRRLTARERVRLSHDPSAAVFFVRDPANGIQCDRCNEPAQVAAIAEGETDAVCYPCYPALHRDLVSRARAFVRGWREAGFSPDYARAS